MALLPKNATVFIVEDDESICDVITHLGDSVGLPVKSFNNPHAFLKAFDPEFTGCIILDVRMPDMSGLDLYEELKKHHCALPVIFISGYPDIPLAVRAIQAGAMDFLVKPFNNQILLEKIQRAISSIPASMAKIQFLKNLELLTRREKEVLGYVVEGSTNKEIAYALDISNSTVELHRTNLMAKMNVKNYAELIKNYWRYTSL